MKTMPTRSVSRFAVVSSSLSTFLSDSASFFHRMSLTIAFVEYDLSHFLKLLMVSSDEAPFFAHILHFHNKPAGILNFADTVAHSD